MTLERVRRCVAATRFVQTSLNVSTSHFMTNKIISKTNLPFKRSVSLLLSRLGGRQVYPYESTLLPLLQEEPFSFSRRGKNDKIDFVNPTVASGCSGRRDLVKEQLWDAAENELLSSLADEGFFQRQLCSQTFDLSLHADERNCRCKKRVKLLKRL